MNTQQINPLAPTTSPTAEQVLNDYRAKAAALRGEAAAAMPLPQQGGFNPFNAQEDESQKDNQGKHISNMEQWLSPIKMDSYDSNKRYTDDKHDNFLTNLEKDPAVKEYGEAFHAYLEYLQSMIQSGTISADDAVSMGRDYIENVVKPIVKKHHSRDGKATLHRPQEIEIPETIKRLKGGK